MKLPWLSPIVGLGIITTLLLSLAGYLGRLHFLLDLTAHFKVQYLLAGLIALAFFSLTRQTWGIGLSLACVLLNGLVVFPWYLPDFQPTSASLPLRVMLANVNVQNRSYRAMIDLIRDEQPDVVAIVETNQDWLQAMKAVSDRLPYSVQSPRAAGFGIALFSKFPLEAQEVNLFESPKDFHLVAKMERDSQPLTIVALHPPPPIRPELFAQRNRELEAIAAYMQTLDTPIVAIGDLNITMWSPNYAPLVNQTSLKNVRRGFGILPSWHSGYLVKIPIDHGLVSSGIQVLQTRIGRNISSDHLPVVIDLGLPTE
ncbi:MAG: endonuclease/exonuclease/phosphatase family protein [Elainellaceae cyanobacterium]